MKVIGLIGGMSWESTAEYYRIINETVKERLGGLYSAKILLYSLNFAEIEKLQREGKWAEVTEVMCDAARRIELRWILPCKVRNIKMKIALIGTGRMGSPMAERILAGGYELTVYNRNRDKAEPLRSSGAEIVSAAADAIDSAECVILMLADGVAIWEVLFRGSPTVDLVDRTVIQMGTISSSESMEFQREVSERGGDYLEAPVLGSTPEASAGKLLVMVGASKSQFDRWSGLLQCFGPNPLLIGEVGKASALKLALNQLITSLTAAFALSLGLVLRRGVEVDLFMNILRQSALYAPTFDKKLKRMLDRDFTNANFASKHLAKDLRLFQTEAEALGLELSTLEGLRRILALTFEKGFAEGDYSALYEVVNPAME